MGKYYDVALRDVDQYIMISVQLNSESLLGLLSKDFYLAALFNILKYFVVVCCLSAQKVFIDFLAQLQL